ncbi:MAG TPA: nucleotidyl transferase AbiEii/AbiGii toxin family protein [Terriglobia bacterium]|nr:nucleotidyl transferase AbiEii/AbiGii toxin family protein [Terriglobia bacterium]
MSETRLHTALRRILKDLADCGAPCALVGGLAVSVRAEPRFTRDLDLAVAVNQDSDAEKLVRLLTPRGWHIDALVEQEGLNRLATVRLIPPKESGLLVDLLFASSGIEREIVAVAEPIEIIEGLTVQVATTHHLIATKVLSRDDERRPQDRADLAALLKIASEDDIGAAREALRAIEIRGFHRGKDLLGDLERLLKR